MKNMNEDFVHTFIREKVEIDKTHLTAFSEKPDLGYYYAEKSDCKTMIC